MKVLLVIDMQNDFIDGALGTEEAVEIVPRVAETIRGFDGLVLATRDTHETDYLTTMEGKKLPVEHCIRGTRGWEIREEIARLIKEPPIDKGTFGSVGLGQYLKDYDENRERIEEITVVGLCTDICVISNALLVKAFLPQTPIRVLADCCAGVTPQSHKNALEAMKVCHIDVSGQ